jgi:hypothetical protein
MAINLIGRRIYQARKKFQFSAEIPAHEMAAKDIITLKHFGFEVLKYQTGNEYTGFQVCWFRPGIDLSMN